MQEEKLEKLITELKSYTVENLPLSTLSDEELEAEIEQIVHRKIADSYYPIETQVALVQSIYSSIRGFGILDSIISDDTITEVMINGPEDIFIEKSGKLIKLDKKFESERRLEDIIQRIVGLAGREVNQASPIVDTRLPDGSRVNVVLPPISLCGPTVTIRKFSKEPMTIEKLIKYGSITEEIAEKLKLLVKAKYNIFICGGTGSGKTTFLNALSNYIPKEERVITIEDSAELQITGVANLVRMETRNANTSGTGEITIRDLIKSSLRMRPERIVVGEVRGAEALDMLQAMNTGHDGSLSTGHANSTRDMLSRLETMVLTGAEGLPLEAVRQQIASALDIIIHLSRLRDHSRKTMEIAEVLGYEAGQIVLNPLYTFEEDEHSTLEKVSGQLQRTKNKMQNVFKLQLSGIKTEI
ncbi:pilus assembly protein CpaF [Mobilisporobacter senegalensis]|uniref:Pilus assembly protein CpaF n=1 Tax=Mobilisporobacter senegalensis TaxID=1329262 RepID=A0A3N1XPV7_9FIRM|nr:CpaF family protein [Mobilisporobacter senegalensis]ROR28704.1 pilus assembly protein CpaF [Mobilisporobacter senegalensis]